MLPKHQQILQVTHEERAAFILQAIPLVRRDLRHLFLELLEPHSAAVDRCSLPPSMMRPVNRFLLAHTLLSQTPSG